jgi:hypothetical protein
MERRILRSGEGEHQPREDVLSDRYGLPADCASAGVT